MPVDAIDVEKLTFAFSHVSTRKETPVLHDVSLTLPKGSRCILVGANGAGKSTLLQILAGKRMTRTPTKVLGQDVFFKTPPGVTYLGTEWAANPVVRSDIVVDNFLDSVGGWRHKERRNKLLDILDVDLEWHMHEISDGERRRVQIVSGLMAPWDVLLLDEVTVDLDVLVRSRLLDFLVEETADRDATILYATHIFDGLDVFPTHLCHLQLGRTLPLSPLEWPIRSSHEVGDSVWKRMNDSKRRGSKLLEVALNWLAEDKEARVRREVCTFGETSRGAKVSDVPTDSETFYRKYDYSR